MNEALALLALLLRLIPELRNLLQGAVAGDAKCVDEVRRILSENPAEKWLAEKALDDNPYRDVP